MLQDLRDQKNSALIVILFAVIIIVFVFMFGMPGADTFSSKSHSDVAEAGGHKVTYDLMRTMILNQYDDNIFGTMQYPAAARQISESIAVIYMLADEGRKAGLRVSDEELHDYITNWESGNKDIMRMGFLHKNEFSQRNYTDALRRMQLSARDYENYKREELLARRYLTLLSSSITVSDASLWQAFAEVNTTATLEYIRLTPEAVGKTFKPLSDAEVSAFVGSGMADIKAYYENNIADFTTPAKAKLHQVVIQKSLAKLDHPGSKTMKTLQARERFAIAKSEAEKAGADFAQIFTDYDESADKDLKGVSGLLPVEIMADEIQTAINGKKVGDVFTAEMEDRFIIGKIVEQTATVVKPLEEVKNEIARSLLNDRRIKNRTEEIASNILAQASSKPLSELVGSVMYANILAEQPTAPAAAPADADPVTGADVPAPAPVQVALPTDLIVIPDFDRVKAQNANEININTGFLMGLGTNDDLARDIRAASDNTVLAKTYSIGLDTLIVKVVAKQPADRAQFDANREAILHNAIAARQAALIGNIDGIIGLRPEYGIWIKQKIQEQTQKGTFKVSNEYFTKLAEQIQSRQAEQKQHGNR